MKTGPGAAPASCTCARRTPVRHVLPPRAPAYGSSIPSRWTVHRGPSAHVRRAHTRPSAEPGPRARLHGLHACAEPAGACMSTAQHIPLSVIPASSSSQPELRRVVAVPLCPPSHAITRSPPNSSLHPILTSLRRIYSFSTIHQNVSCTEFASARHCSTGIRAAAGGTPGRRRRPSPGAPPPQPPPGIGLG
jgi:hypothetical protein